MKKRVLVLFPDEWDHAVASEARDRGRLDLHFEGFDLFRFPDNARLFTFDALKFADRLVRRYAGRIDAVTTSDEQFGPFIASRVAERLRLPHTPLETVLTLQHKYHAREAFERVAPGCGPRFGLIRAGYSRPDEVPLPYPFYVKPSKAAFSVLARRVDSFEELRAHTRFGWFEEALVRRLVQPFADFMRDCPRVHEDPFSMVAEEIVRGRQVTANGYALDGRVTMLGTVDSIMYPGTDQFQRFQYPSALPARILERIDALAGRLLEGVGFSHGMFNIEMRFDAATGRLGVIEVNPRAAGQFYDLFQRVDGYSLFDADIDLQCGLAPEVRRRAGPDACAASFVLRDLSGEGLGRWPSKAEVAALRSRNPDVRAMIYPKRGTDLRREMKWLGSYRYGVFNLGAASPEALYARFHRLCADIDFHPRGHRVPNVEALLAQAGDD